MCAVFFFTWLPTIWKNGMFQINVLGEGWYDLLDPDLTWIVAVGGSSPWIWLMLGFLQRLRSSRRITFDFSSLILQLAVCYLVFQPRAGSVGLSKREWEDLLGQREPESSGFAGRFSPLVPDSPPPPRPSCSWPKRLLGHLFKNAQHLWFGGRNMDIDKCWSPDMTEPGLQLCPLLCVWPGGSVFNLSEPQLSLICEAQEGQELHASHCLLGDPPLLGRGT